MGHNEATGSQRDQQIDSTDQQIWAIHSRCYPVTLKRRSASLISQFNPSNPGNGMVKLLNNGANILTQVKLTDAITAGSVLKMAKK
jgi:hypothetical protein